MKPCSKCGSTRRSDKTARCLDCTKARSAQWRQDNPDTAKTADLTWKKANREKVKMANAAWNLANPAKKKAAYAAWHKANAQRRKELTATWRQANRERTKATAAAWQKAHREQARALARRRRAREYNARGTHTAKQWLALLASYHGKCVYCGKHATTQDHIDPLSRNGSNDIDNIAPACVSCNSSKKTKPLLVWMLTRYIRTEQKEKK